MHGTFEEKFGQFLCYFDLGFLFVFSYTVCSKVPIDFPSGGYSGVDVDR